MVISFEDAEKRLNHRTDIKLCKEFYISWSSKAKFFDFIVNDYFDAIPRNILKYNSSHPKRNADKKKDTILKKYGVDNLAKSEEIKTKIKNTNIAKYGVENPMQNKDIKFKAIKTLLEKYNIDNPAKLSSNRIITETGEYLSDWYKNLLEPKPGYSTLIHHFKNNNISLEELNAFIENYKTNKTLSEIKIESLFNIKHYNRNPIQSLKYKPDFKLSDKVYLNVDGLYWHSEKVQTNKHYHFKLRKTFEENKLRIFQFRENELEHKTLIIKSMILNSLNLISNKIYARNCYIKQIEHKEAKNFLNENHLMGSTKAKHIGLFEKQTNKFVSILSYKCKNNVCKIERFCSLLNTNVLGSFSKLLNYLEKNILQSNITEIHNWVDLRYGTGNHLLNKGFILKKETLGWNWTDYKNTYNRLKCRANMDYRRLSEKEYAKELKLYKIYDAGQRLYIKKVNYEEK